MSVPKRSVGTVSIISWNIVIICKSITQNDVSSQIVAKYWIFFFFATCLLQYMTHPAPLSPHLSGIIHFYEIRKHIFKHQNGTYI